MSNPCDAPLLSGKLEHVATVAKRRTGKRPSPATVWRWCKRGLRGGSIRLHAVFHSGYWATTDAAFDAFLAAQTQAAHAQSEKPVEDVSDADLRSAGLL